MGWTVHSSKTMDEVLTYAAVAVKDPNTSEEALRAWLEEVLARVAGGAV